MKKLLLSVVLMLVFSQVQAHCFNYAAQKFNVDEDILRAIAKVESGYNANAVNVNKNHSVDLGLMQINSIHVPKLSKAGIKMEDLLEPCTNVIVGAWLLRGSIDRANGDLWRGVGYYHSATPRFYLSYISKVKKAFATNNQG
ncbi:transglycosylase SLT domain-containing protein (plasmid) [Enterobacteriaceae bacterium Kacie_13]|nr:transglycosylase SLT domain-containing protein [Enterobacteriaceae bacterium Kacie_13]